MRGATGRQSANGLRMSVSLPSPPRQTDECEGGCHDQPETDESDRRPASPFRRPGSWRRGRLGTLAKIGFKCEGAV